MAQHSKHDTENQRRQERKRAEQRENNRARNETKVGWKMAGIGFEVATEVLAGLLIGLAIDHFAGTGKRWTTIGGIVGIVVGLYSLIRSTLKLNRQLDQSYPTQGRGKPISDDEWDAWDEDENDEPRDD